MKKMATKSSDLETKIFGLVTGWHLTKKVNFKPCQKLSSPLPLSYGGALRQQRMYRFGHVQSQASDYQLIQALHIDHPNGY